MPIISSTQPFSRRYFGDANGNPLDPSNADDAGQNASTGGVDYFFFARSDLFPNPFPLDPHPADAQPPSDPSVLYLLDDNGALSPATASSVGGSALSKSATATATKTPAPTLVGSSTGLQFNLVWDSSVGSAPAGFMTAAIAAATMYTSYYSNREVINIHVGFGEVNGYSLGTGALGASMSYGYIENYAQVAAALKRDAASSSWQASADANLPAADPTKGGKFFVSTAEAKALGQVSGTGSAVDGFVGLSSLYAFDYAPNTKPAANQYDAFGTFAHEFAEVMGRVGSLGSAFGAGVYTPLDLFRYSSPGVHDLTPAAGYFSVNNGATNLGAYNNPLNGGDVADWIPTLKGDSYGSGYAGAIATVSPTDIIENSVLGYTMTAAALNYTKTPLLA